MGITTVAYKPRVYRDPPLNILMGYNTPLNKSNVFYKALKEQYPHLARYDDREIRDYIRRFNQAITEVASQERDGIQLPMKMGMTMVVSIPGHKVVDKLESGRQGKKVYHNNLHTDSMVAMAYYSSQVYSPNVSTPKAMYKNSYYWTFLPCVHYKAYICKAFRKDYKRYRTIDFRRQLRHLKISDIYRNISNKVQKHKEFEF